MIAIRKSQVSVLGRLSYRIIAVWDLDSGHAGQLGLHEGLSEPKAQGWGVDHLILSQRGQIIPRKLLRAPTDFQTFLRPCHEAHSKSH